MNAFVSRRALAAGLVVVAVLWPRPAAASHMAVQWKIEDGGNGHFYEIVAGGLFTWDQIRVRAPLSTVDGVPGYLATITSPEEQAFVLGLMPTTLFPKYYFIGGVQDPSGPEPDGGWSWITGEPWSYTNWSADPLEPNNYDGTEHYLTLKSQDLGGTWNDVGAEWLSINFIVEYSVVPEPSAALLLPTSALALLRRRRGNP